VEKGGLEGSEVKKDSIFWEGGIGNRRPRPTDQWCLGLRGVFALSLSLSLSLSLTHTHTHTQIYSHTHIILATNGTWIRSCCARRGRASARCCWSTHARSFVCATLLSYYASTADAMRTREWQHTHARVATHTHARTHAYTLAIIDSCRQRNSVSETWSCSSSLFSLSATTA